MEWTLIKQLAELGGVVVLAGLIFIMSHKARLASEKRLSGLLKADQETRTHHTRVLTELIAWLKGKNNH